MTCDLPPMHAAMRENDEMMRLSTKMPEKNPKLRTTWAWIWESKASNKPSAAKTLSFGLIRHFWGRLIYYVSNPRIT